ncbi:hypothetical protein QE357_005183 [Siphonobacter sp. BAB-5404]|nr:hypothetical protein [Siphonobacter sp. SORGH_AS_0500]
MEQASPDLVPFSHFILLIMTHLLFALLNQVLLFLKTADWTDLKQRSFRPVIVPDLIRVNWNEESVPGLVHLIPGSLLFSLWDAMPLYKDYLTTHGFDDL